MLYYKQIKQYRRTRENIYISKLECCGFNPRLGQNKYLQTGISCFSAKNKKNIKIPNSDEQKAVGKWQNRKPKHIKRMDNNCQIPELHTDIRRHIKTGSLEVRVMYRYVITFLLVECYLWELARRIYSSEFSWWV